ncbi:hypothetical protein Tco_0299718 [Tanacetum coccineum]
MRAGGFNGWLWGARASGRWRGVGAAGAGARLGGWALGERKLLYAVAVKGEKGGSGYRRGDGSATGVGSLWFGVESKTGGVVAGGEWGMGGGSVGWSQHGHGVGWAVVVPGREVV